MLREQLRKVPGLRAAGTVIRAARAERLLERAAMGTPAALKRFDKLHLGAGSRQMEGWANLDIEGDNLIWDLRKRLPIEDGRIRLVYSEHFVEHISREDGVRLLKEARRVLRPDGVIRVATPDLRVLAQAFLENRTVDAPHADYYPATPCQGLNEGMRLWGHTFVYDEAELRMVFEEAGFRDITRMPFGKSEHPELDGIETRGDLGDLILEAKR